MFFTTMAQFLLLGNDLFLLTDKLLLLDNQTATITTVKNQINTSRHPQKSYGYGYNPIYPVFMLGHLRTPTQIIRPKPFMLIKTLQSYQFGTFSGSFNGVIYLSVSQKVFISIFITLHGIVSIRHIIVTGFLGERIGTRFGFMKVIVGGIILSQFAEHCGFFSIMAGDVRRIRGRTMPESFIHILQSKGIVSFLSVNSLKTRIYIR